MPESSNNAHKTVDNFRKFNIFFHCLICVVGVAGNGLVIYIAGLKMKKTVNTICFLNLAVADFLFSLFLIFGIIYESRELDWPFGQFMCVLNSLVSVLNMFASVFLLTAISLDRCLSTWMVVWAQTKRTVPKARVFCLLIWIASVLCSLPFVIKRKIISVPAEKTMCVHGLEDIEIYNRLEMFRFVVAFLLPFVIIVISYVAIWIRVKRLQKKNKLKPFRIILAVILAFFFCWLPFYVYNFYTIWLYKLRVESPSEELFSSQKVSNQIGLFIVSFAYLNSCLNPFLYVFMCEEFQTKLKQSLVAVFESAFAEEHFMQHSQYKNKSNSQGETEVEMTQSSVLEG